jgi:signal transduction histidine kinase
MKLKNRIQLFSTFLLFILLLLTSIAIYSLFYKITVDGEMRRLEHEAKNILSVLNSENAEQVDPGNLLKGYLPSNGMIRIIARDSELKEAVATNTEYRSFKIHYQTKQSDYITEFNNEKFAVVSIPMIWKDGTVVNLEVVNHIGYLFMNLNLLKIVLAVSSLIVIVPAFFAGKMLSKIILNPIHSMIRTMEDIQRSNAFHKIELENDSKDELHKMAETFNRMIDILQRNFEKQQQFVSNASHELKTPLTVIESYAKMLKRWGKEKEDVLEESVEAIHSEAVRMKELTQQMLFLANSEEEGSLQFIDTDLISLCKETGDQLEKVHRRKVDVVSDLPNLQIKIDPQKIRQLLVILLDNALKYSTDSIAIRIGIAGSNAFIKVEDHGIGIPKEDISKVFDRFFRVDKVRSRETGGSGLGLSIAKRIVIAHKGEIELHSEEGRGTVVTVFIPYSSRVVMK